ncbi:hypothetical protein ACFFF5_03170 [Lederbergia wuyishanensis]|uniref:Spore coat protein B n=1 Tax=Lederbergia wuyishanensis TaxID=1347903 RepID=A0ABU0D059_9BACI|nr:hypothetical protein [Lederbergia wuyishanensis]MCJ8006418.1 hypothetical protein [Lederbergia wuyishanensis]MDQ0341792.1 spore coat protein B [Lederbergia wuyishanensis]
MNMEMMLTLVGKSIKIGRGGAESRIGQLMTVADDHVALLTQDEGIVYYNTQHIKSLTENAKTESTSNIAVSEDYEFIQARDMNSVLGNLKYHWIKINRGGPESIEGVLDEVNGDYLTIISNEEIIRVSMFHIRNFSYGAKVDQSLTQVDVDLDKEKDNNQQNAKEENTKEDKNEKKKNKESKKNKDKKDKSNKQEKKQKEKEGKKS